MHNSIIQLVTAKNTVTIKKICKSRAVKCSSTNIYTCEGSTTQLHGDVSSINFFHGYAVKAQASQIFIFMFALFLVVQLIELLTVLFLKNRKREALRTFDNFV